MKKDSTRKKNKKINQMSRDQLVAEIAKSKSNNQEMSVQHRALIKQLAVKRDV